MKISLFYKNVTVLDYAYLDDHKGVVGDALKVHVEFIGKTDEEGVVYDFSYAKKKVKEIIDRDCDHRLVVPTGLINTIDRDKTVFTYTYGLNDEKIDYQCPRQGICELPFHHVNKVTIASYLEEVILAEMPKTVSAVKITLEDESFGKVSDQGIEKEKPTFHYTHGLKEHYGNCQRLFHGHKNTVDVYINGTESWEWENYLASDLFKNNIHFCKWENVLNKEEVFKYSAGQIPKGVVRELPQVEIGYTSAQGEFKAKLPGKEVFFMESESTVENLSMLFANIVKEKVGAGKNVTVRAYEGVAKGAITSL